MSKLATAKPSIRQRFLAFCASLVLLLSLSFMLWYMMVRPCRILATCIQAKLLYPTDVRIGAYYQTSLAHIYATKLVLTIFRRVYPSAPIFVYIDSDGGHPFDWNAHHPIVMLPFDARLRSAVSHGTHFMTASSCVAYVNRIIKAAQDLDWLVLLEDDVWVCNRIDAAALLHDMNGQCLAKYDVNVWGHMIPGDCYGGYGGFVLRGSFLRRMHVDRSYIHDILAKIRRPIASDELLSALFLRSNGTIGKITDYAEEMTTAAVIVHQMKTFYHLKTTCSAELNERV
eukprot:CAMPEP_0172156308 /NCGR_PEP_ID=MMETSP1050-20130122/3123_1 /TAXON_ID=233186 /ORGANISM="Cryptomonas curvata, Strain CCAP979/52" /LENGTH=284 /DNA_ID=CAMNT_0012825331 /DNA_START=118 /DNA_END=972 /DNA_ORIENTATION=-